MICKTPTKISLSDKDHGILHLNVYLFNLQALWLYRYESVECLVLKFVTACLSSVMKTWWTHTIWQYALVRHCCQFRQTVTQSSITHTSWKLSAMSSLIRMRYLVDWIQHQIISLSMNVALLKITGICTWLLLIVRLNPGYVISKVWLFYCPLQAKKTKYQMKMEFLRQKILLSAGLMSFMGYT